MVTMFFIFMVLVLALLLYCNHLMDMLLRERCLNRENIEIDDEDIILWTIWNRKQAMGNVSNDIEQFGSTCTEKIRYCPRCKTGVLYERVPRPWWVKTFLFFLPLKRYKCYRCNRKSYIWEGRNG